MEMFVSPTQREKNKRVAGAVSHHLFMLMTLLLVLPVLIILGMLIIKGSQSSQSTSCSPARLTA